MVMTAFGDTINPGQLNAWMKEREVYRGGFDGDGNVSWYAPQEHSSKVEYVQYIRKKMYKGNKQVNSATVTPENELNQYLEECNLVVVRVYNSSSGRSHWVVVTHREGKEYRILDPGFQGKRYLSDYGSFWNYAVIFRKKDK